MKKILISLATLFVALAPAVADEGMWLLPLLQKMNAGAMQDLGCRLTPDQIYSVNHSSLKDAIVQFGGGCTGEIISNEGLLVTNHHCGYSSIQALSTPEHNYLEDGYWAMKRSEELPVSGLTVKFLQNMTDVTDILNKTYEATLKKYKKNGDASALAEAARDAMAKDLVAQAEKENPNCTARVTSFYNQNVYYLIVYKIYRDVRFVGAPPASSGKFGGETDNWMWPRHTCDFSMFRVYAGKDNEPADYSEDNVPLTPKQALKVSLRGVQDGDFAMIMGYPGRTQRFQTAAQLNQMMDINGIKVAARTVRQNAMKAGMESDPTVRLQYSSKYASSSNGWKKWQGEELAFQKLNIIGREEQKEADFMAWVGKNKKRQAAYGTALADIKASVDAVSESQKALTLLTESIYTVGLNSLVSGYASTYTGLYRAEGDSVAAHNAACDAVIGLYKDFDPDTEKKMAVAVIEHYRQNAAPANYPEIPGFADMDVTAFVDNLFATSVFGSAQTVEALRGMGYSSFFKDPAVAFYNNVVSAYMKLLQASRSEEYSELEAKGSKAFGAGLMEWKKGEASYPDANSTMRFTYGSVKSYSPKDAVIYNHFTTLKGVMEKEDPTNYEFRVPAKVKELYEAGDYGQYADKDGTLHTCFLTNNDITGGNSGSPVLDADGCLIGLAFDGNWESMSSDVMFEPELQRCINVDIRYVLFMVDKFGGAGHLLDEMTLVK